MRDKPVSEAAGVFDGWKPVVMAGFVCRKCNGPLIYRTWESSCGGFEDQQFKCTSCSHSYWVESSDS